MAIQANIPSLEPVPPTPTVSEFEISLTTECDIPTHYQSSHRHPTATNASTYVPHHKRKIENTNDDYRMTNTYSDTPIAPPNLQHFIPNFQNKQNLNIRSLDLWLQCSDIMDATPSLTSKQQQRKQQRQQNTNNYNRNTVNSNNTNKHNPSLSGAGIDRNNPNKTPCDSSCPSALFWRSKAAQLQKELQQQVYQRRQCEQQRDTYIDTIAWMMCDQESTI
eukprot:453016_1